MLGASGSRGSLFPNFMYSKLKARISHIRESLQRKDARHEYKITPVHPPKYSSKEGPEQAPSGGDEDHPRDLEISTLRGEVQRLQAELAEAHARISNLLTKAPKPSPTPTLPATPTPTTVLTLVPTSAPAQDERSSVDFKTDHESEVHCTSLATTAWVTDHFRNGDGVRLFINHNNTLAELIASHNTVPNPNTDLQWYYRFISRVVLMPDAAIAAANSMVSKDLIRDSDAMSDRGRNIIRVFSFDNEGILREWIWQDSISWRRSTLAIKNIDPRSLSVVCWTEAGFAEWSLFYITKEEFVDGSWRGGRLMERRCSGGPTGRWSRATSVGWSRNQEKEKEGEGIPQPETHIIALQSDFSATTNHDGTDRRIFYLDKGNSQGSSKILTLKWGGHSLNKWVRHLEPGRDAPCVHTDGIAPSFSAMHLPGTEGLRIYFQDCEVIGEWITEDSRDNGKWTKFQFGSNSTSKKAVVASAFYHEKGQHQRRYVFSLFEGKIVQTTYFPELDWQWFSKPITMNKLQT